MISLRRIGSSAFVCIALLAGSLQSGCGGYQRLEASLGDAKRELDQGHPGCAFLRVETLRRATDKDAFGRSFEVVFLGQPRFDPSEAGEEKLKAQLAANPKDADVALKLADVYTSRGDWAQAEPLLQRAMGLRPDDIEPVAVLARIRETTGNHGAAVRLLEDFAAKHPDSIEGALLGLPKEDGPERLAALEAAVKKHPGDGRLTFELAASVQHAGDLPAAKALFLQAAQEAPKNAMVQAWTARFLLKAMTSPNEALVYYYRAYFLDPDYYETEFVESRISRYGDFKACR